MDWFDTHAHLSDAKFDSDRDAAVARALDAGVTRLVEIADGPDEWPKARALSRKFSKTILWAAGLHPYYAGQSNPEIWRELRSFAAEPGFVAIGEVGLDYAKSEIPPDRQKEAFSEAIELALSLEKPLIVHCRNAYPDLIPILREQLKEPGAPACPGVIHCFSGTAADAEAVLTLGFYLGVDGPVSYPSAKPLREALSSVPLDRLVLETDSPYLPPQTHRGQRNEPSLLPGIGSALAVLKNVSPLELARRTFDNGLTLFRQK